MALARGAGGAVTVDVLGPLVLRVDGAAVTVPGLLRQTALAVLALAGARPVSRDALVDELWPDGPPADATQAVQSHVSRLRRHLGAHAALLRVAAGGYALDLDPPDVDALRVRALASRVQGLLATDPGAAVALADDALALWRGDALAGLGVGARLEAERVALAELRSQLTEGAVEARLALGEAVVPAAAAAVALDPLRERAVVLLVRALAADGRAGAAMEAAAAYRRRLAEETGLSPGRAFADLERDVAAGDVARSPARSAPPVRLAAPTGPLVGREGDLDELSRLVRTHRVLTLTGPGGVGKTRLALEVAARDAAATADDVVVVRLAEVTAGTRVAAAAATALGLRGGPPPTAASVARATAGRAALVVLDNAEHVRDGAAELVETLAREAPRVRVLTTSRTSLHVAGEYVVRLQPLPLPSPGTPEEVVRQPAVAAFLEHARRLGHAVDLGPDDVEPLVEVLRALDGLPLAIELAAGQAGALSPAALRDRLARALDALGGAAGDARHRTLRTTITWSTRLLDPADRAALDELALFPAGVDLGTFELVAHDASPHEDPLAVLGRLVDASLVVPAGRPVERYTLLETIRAFLLDELAATGARDAAERRFLARATAIADRLGATFAAGEEAAADRQLRAELATLRAAQDLARRRGEPDARVATTLALDEVGMWRDLPELWSWAVDLARDPVLRQHPHEAQVLGCAAEASWLLGDLDGAVDLATRALALAAATDPPRPVHSAFSALASVHLFRGEHAAARAAWTRGAATAPGPGPYWALAALAAHREGDAAAVGPLMERARAAALPGSGLTAIAWVEYVTGELARGHDDAASTLAYARAVEAARAGGARFVEGVATVGLASVWTATGDVAAAADGYRLLLRYWADAGNATQLWTTARDAAVLLADQVRPSAALALLVAADRSPASAAVVGPAHERLAQARGRAEAALGPAAVAELLEAVALQTDAQVVGGAVDALGSLRAEDALGSLRDDDPGAPA